MAMNLQSGELLVPMASDSGLCEQVGKTCTEHLFESMNQEGFEFLNKHYDVLFRAAAHCRSCCSLVFDKVENFGILQEFLFQKNTSFQTILHIAVASKDFGWIQDVIDRAISLKDCQQTLHILMLEQDIQGLTCLHLLVLAGAAADSGALLAPEDSEQTEEQAFFAQGREVIAKTLSSLSEKRERSLLMNHQLEQVYEDDESGKCLCECCCSSQVLGCLSCPVWFPLLCLTQLYACCCGSNQENPSIQTNQYLFPCDPISMHGMYS